MAEIFREIHLEHGKRLGIKDEGFIRKGVVDCVRFEKPSLKILVVVRRFDHTERADVIVKDLESGRVKSSVLQDFSLSEDGDRVSCVGKIVDENRVLGSYIELIGEALRNP